MTTAQLGGVMGQTGHRYGPTSSAAFEAGAWPIRRWIQNAPVFESGHDQWIDSVLHRIKEAFLLNDDWDHEGAVAVSQGAVSNARDLAVALHASKSRRPFVSATPLGGIGFEWSGFDVEMFIDVYSQRFEVTVRRSDTGAYEESEIPELGPEFVSAIASFIRQAVLESQQFPWVLPYVDDPKLGSNILIYRAVNPESVHWESLDGRGLPTLKSSAFQHMSEAKAQERGYPSPAMSVILSHILERYGESKERVLDDLSEHWGIASITVGAVRDVFPAVGVCEDPIPDAPWHGLVFACTRKMMKKPEKGGLRQRATLLVPPSRSW